MTDSRFWTTLAVGTLVASAFASEDVLIVQQSAEAKPSGGIELELAYQIANDLSSKTQGRSIIWSLTDPVFRQAAMDGKLGHVPDWPSLAEAFSAANKLRVRYVASYKITKKGRKLSGKFFLYRDGKQIWVDEESQTIEVRHDFDYTDTERSIGRTWASKLLSGPFKSIATYTTVVSPKADPGQAPAAVDPRPNVPGIDNARLKQVTDELIAAGKVSSAVVALRDGVDAAPFDPVRRRMLIDGLKDYGLVREAAKEARRSAELMPDDLEFRLLAARQWLQLGEPKEAQIDLNEAVARKPDAVETRLLLAETALLDLDPARALENLEKPAKAGDPEALYLRAIARALLGGSDGMEADLTALAKTSSGDSDSTVGDRYGVAASVLDSVLQETADTVRKLGQKAAVDPKDKAVRSDIDEQLRTLKARNVFLSLSAVPTKNKNSHAQRVLAHRLLSQSLIDLQTYLTSGSEDALTDSRIDLGEALKKAAVARQKYAAELGVSNAAISGSRS